MGGDAGTGNAKVVSLCGPSRRGPSRRGPGRRDLVFAFGFLGRRFKEATKVAQTPAWASHTPDEWKS